MPEEFLFSQYANDIAKNPLVYQFKVGAGFKRVGPLPMPANPVAAASVCEPEGDAVPGSWHKIKPPGQPDGVQIPMRWNPEKKWWTPALETAGRRIAYSSAYLAAVGWTYLEAE